MADEPLLLHSLSEHGELIFGALDAGAPRRIVEIGSETGGFSKELLDWAGRNGATLVTVEPYPTPEVRRLAADVAHFELVDRRAARPRSADIEPGRRLRDRRRPQPLDRAARAAQAAYASGARPLAILHDVGWPCARRDQYYAPARAPRRGAPAALVRERAATPTAASSSTSAGSRPSSSSRSRARRAASATACSPPSRTSSPSTPGSSTARSTRSSASATCSPADAPYAAAPAASCSTRGTAATLLARLERNRVRLYARVARAAGPAAPRRAAGGRRGRSSWRTGSRRSRRRTRRCGSSGRACASGFRAERPRTARLTFRHGRACSNRGGERRGGLGQPGTRAPPRRHRGPRPREDVPHPEAAGAHAQGAGAASAPADAPTTS